MHSFTLDGVNSRVYGLMVSGAGTYNAPQRDITSVDVPGRNGALTIDNGRFKNIAVTYDAFIVGGFKARAEASRAWLCSVPGYRVLADDYDTDHYRRARFVNGLDFNTFAQNGAGKTKIQFDCDPRRFLNSGDTESTFSASGTIVNPTLFTSLPLIVVSGSGAGVVVINGYTVNISAISTSVTLDCETKRAYSGTTPKDNTITGAFPQLKPGNNSVSFSGGVTSVAITPRWWTV